MARKEIQRLEIKINESKYVSFQKVKSPKGARQLMYWIVSFFVMIVLVMFLPWTQNVTASGELTTLRPEQRPQTINSRISGRIEKWYVIEGQHVAMGDTLVFISEVKDKFLDPSLVERTELQLKAKTSALNSYDRKVDALTNQIGALQNEFRLKQLQAKNKFRQAKNKVVTDSMNYEIAKLNYSISVTRLNRADSLFKLGIMSLKDLESRRIKLQNNQNKLISSENKLLITRNDYLNAQIELNNLFNQFNSKISKAESDKMSAESAFYDTKASVSKLQNELSNYQIRKGYYYITAAQDGYVVKTYKPGTGMIVKEGNPVVEIMPINIELAAALYVRPVDLPLIKIGERIRLTFDGWPALVFSGWPGSSFGTFSGEVYAIDKVISSKKGKFRVLIIPDKEDVPWPDKLRVGSGSQGIFLLNDVPIWYEIWRQINGFPPDYYDGAKSKYHLDETIDENYHTK